MLLGIFVIYMLLKESIIIISSKNYYIMSALEQLPSHEGNESFLPTIERGYVEVTQDERSIGGAIVRRTRFVPDQLSDDVPVIINGGWCAPAKLYFKLAAGVAESGRDVSVVHPPRSQDLRHSISSDNFKDVLRLQSQANWAILRELEYADIVAHSMGLVIALRTANQKPNNMRSISASGGAGLDGPHGVTRMALRCLGEATDFNYRTGIFPLQTLSHVLRDPVRTAREGVSAARADVHLDLEQARSNGIKIGAFLFGKDKLFSPEAILHHSGTHFDSFEIIPDAKHNYPITNPAEHAAQQATSLRQLNMKLKSA